MSSQPSASAKSGSDARIAALAGAGRVLIVDDDANNRAILKRLLVALNYVVESAGDGAAALACIDRRVPDLVLLDVQMPGLDGFEVCRRIKAHPATRLIPVVFMTGLSDQQSRIQGIDAGGDDFLRKPFDPEELKSRLRSLLRIKRYTDDLESAESVIQSLALTVEARDAYTEGHCQRLAEYATALGVVLGLGADEQAALQRGGYLHDVGKIGIPDAILLKHGRLTTAEFEVMKQHTVIGDKLCGNLRSLVPVRAIVRHHHESLDGSGYPDGLAGLEIPLLAQIVRIVDTYDAITTSRPYRAALAPEHAFSELRMEVAHGHCSRDLVEAFIAERQASLITSARIASDNSHGPSRDILRALPGTLLGD